MANPNPNTLQARLGKRLKAKPGNLQELSGMLWEALETARELLGADDDNTKLKAIHALSQTASSYARVYEVGELEARLEALEQMYTKQVKGAA